jgi:hypothetical protein
MDKRDVNPDALASKTFTVTILGALLYIVVVFAFVIFGNRREEATVRKTRPPETAISFPSPTTPSPVAGSAHPAAHHD